MKTAGNCRVTVGSYRGNMPGSAGHPNVPGESDLSYPCDKGERVT